MEKRNLFFIEPDFLPKAKTKANGHITYVCPKCGNGTGADGSGIAQYTNEENTKYLYKCFKCGNTFDIISLYMATYNTDYTTAVKELCNEYNVTLPTTTEKKSLSKKTQKSTDLASEHTNEIRNRQNYIEECKKNIRDETITEYLTERGITTNTAVSCGLGYDRMKNCLIIPNNHRGSYTERFLSGDTRYKKHGPQSLQAYTYDTNDKYYFLVEGQLDAISIYQQGYNALTTGTVSIQSQELEDYIKNNNIRVIVAFDNDTCGIERQISILSDFNTREVFLYGADTKALYGQNKDGNEALIKNSEEFNLNLHNVRVLAKKRYQLYIHERKEEYEKKYSVARYFEDFENSITNSNTDYIPTGYRNLDLALDGGLYEGLYFLGAISSLGKTTFLLQMADQIANNGHDILFFSLEMSKNELISKSISRLTNNLCIQKGYDIKLSKTSREITTRKKYQYYTPQDKEIISRAMDTYREQYAPNIYIYTEDGTPTIEDIENVIEEHIKATGNKPVVIIDYIQILEPLDSRLTDKQNTDHNVARLKRLTHMYHIPIIGISSFNRANYNTGVSMEAFKESGAIEYSSDVLLGLQFKNQGEKNFDINEAKAKSPREVELVVLKNRNGLTGIKKSFLYYPKYNNYLEENL